MFLICCLFSCRSWWSSLRFHGRRAWFWWSEIFSLLLFCHELSFIDWLSHRAFSNFHFTSAQPQLFINFFYVFFRMKVVHFLQERATLVLMTMKTNFSMMTIWKMAAGKDGTTALRLTVLMTVIMTSKLTKESLYIVWRQIKTLRETQSSYHFAFTCCSRHSRRCHWNVTDHF